MNANNDKPVQSVRLQLAVEMMKSLIQEPVRSGQEYVKLILFKSDGSPREGAVELDAAQQMAYAAYALADALIEYEQQEKPQ